ncbi:MAG: glutaredoxin domain-containing protein [Chloroflexota bacterium]
MSAAGPMITLYGTTWCGASRRVRALLDQSRIPYRWVDIDQDEAAAKFVESANHGNRSVPTLVWPDGSMLVEPTTAELETKLGVTLQ